VGDVLDALGAVEGLDGVIAVTAEPRAAEAARQAGAPADSAAADTLPAEPPRFRLAPDAQTWVESTLRSLTLREKAGQMVLAWTGGDYPGPASPQMEALYTHVRRDGVGGIIISIGSPQAYVAKLNALQRNAEVPLLVMTDMESGPGMRLTGAGTDFPPVMGLAATGSDSLAFEVGRVIGVEAKAVGLHLTLSPVLDVNSNPENPIINTRSFGEDPAAVGRFAAAYVRGVHAGGLLAAGKHFPGHGDTRTDSHIDLPRIDADRARLDAVELPPFRAAVMAGIDGMLVGHIALPRAAEDDRPASLSRAMTSGILRGEMKFDGLVITDAMNMGGLTRRYSQGEAAVLAIEAGADLLLQPTDIPGVLDAVTRAVETGRLTEARIDESVRRILSAKARAGLMGRRLADPAGLAAAVGTPAHRALARTVAARSITLARDERGLVPLTGAPRRVLAVTYVDGQAGGGTLAAALERAGIGCKAYYRVPTHLQPAMREYAPAVELPGTDEAARTHLAIPMSPVLSRAQAAAVVAAVRDAGLDRPH
ncbi:MAG TPA: glycoside hydrolase family 3 N-terminal domain-containing protein, partial [Longimicrobium sp.]|nr:glycoside hydrolase family 3 N-terminal domain-containing protein [Longimicrobium sp.]